MSIAEHLRDIAKSRKGHDFQFSTPLNRGEIYDKKAWNERERKPSTSRFEVHHQRVH